MTASHDLARRKLLSLGAAGLLSAGVMGRADRVAAMQPAIADALPGAVRHLLGGSRVAADVKGGALASYLLFESAYTRELMALGRADAMKQHDEVLRFFGWASPASAA